METPARLATPEPQPAAVPPATQAIAKPIAKPWIAVVLGIALLLAVGVLVKLLLKPAHRPQAVTPPVVAAPLPASLDLPGGTMVLVPAGEFLYGQMGAPTTLPAFYIDKTEVTNKAYGLFCKQTGHARPPNFPRG